MLLLLPLACAPAPEEEVDPGVPVDPLYVPDLSGVDLDAAWSDAFALALSIQTGPVWSAHVDALGLRTSGCPDLWAAPPEDTLEVDEDAGGLSWVDRCESGAVGFSGAAWWDTSVSVDGDEAVEPGATTTASRTLVADALVSQDGQARFELDGEVEDSVTRTRSPTYDHWTWSTLVTGTVTGDGVVDGGYRADQYLYVEGGDTARLESRGNVYLFEGRLHDRFDSVGMDLSFVGEDGAGPADCTAEPTGWLSLRDENAYWYDVVFLADDGETVDTGLDPACDGCGTLYVRGVETGTVCPDLSFSWDGRLAPPDTGDFVLSIHDLP